MQPSEFEPPFDQFIATGERVITERPDADPDLVREIFLEVAGVLYNGMALDGLDEHDASAVAAGLCDALVSDDPAIAVRARAETALTDTALHDPENASGAYLFSATILQL